MQTTSTSSEVSTSNGYKKLVIRTVEMHTGGEPLRIVVAGKSW